MTIALGARPGHPPPFGDGHAEGVFALRPDLDDDVAGVEDGGLGEAGDHARVVRGGAVAAVSGTVEAFEDIGPGGDGLDGGGGSSASPSPRRAGSGSWG
jgi:hypothetical protein